MTERGEKWNSEKFKKGMAFILSGLILISIFYFFSQHILLRWPKMFPRYSKGSCIKDVETQRIWRIINYEKKGETKGIPALVLKKGNLDQSGPDLGEIEYLQKTDHPTLVIRCPQ